MPIDSPVLAPVSDSFVEPVKPPILPAIVPSVLLAHIPPRRPGIGPAAAFTLHFVSHEPFIHAKLRPDTVAAAVKPFQTNAVESRLLAQTLDQLLTAGVAQCSDIDTLDPRAQRPVFLALHPSLHSLAVDHASKRHGPLDSISRKRIADVSQKVLVALDTQEQTPALFDVESEVTELDFSDTLRESTGDFVSHLTQVHGAARRSRERATDRRLIR